MKSKFSECPDFSCSRSDGTLEPVKLPFPPGGGGGVTLGISGWGCAAGTLEPLA